MYYPLPTNEPERLAELLSLDLLHTPQEEDYNNIASLVAYIAGCATGHVSIIGQDIQWLKAKVGFGDQETPREHALCAHVIVQDDIMVVEDTTLDERFVNNPLVTGPQNLRFYAGVPIYGPGGYPIGTVCALDNKPKVLTNEQKNALRIIAQQASRLIELRKRNLEIAARAAEQLQLERKTLNHHFVQQEEERKVIGYELHENFCQVLAAALQQLAALPGATQQQNELLQGVRSIMTSLLRDMRSFSTNIDPVGHLAFGMEEKLKQILCNYEQVSGLTIAYTCTGDLDQVRLDHVGHLFRIVLEWLAVYAQEGVQQQPIQVSIVVAKNAVLRIGQQAAALKDSPQSSVLFNGIRKRCEMIQGSAVLEKSTGSNQLVITIPL